MFNFLKKSHVMVISLLVTTASHADSWQSIHYLEPELLYESEAPQGAVAKLTQVNSSSFAKAIKNVFDELPRYYPVPPTVSELQSSNFYQEYDLDGGVFLANLTKQGAKDLILFGQLEFDDLENQVTVSLNGYDGDKQTEWKVVMGKFHYKELAILTEVYTQLIFEVLNEPSAGLKPIYKQVEE